MTDLPTLPPDALQAYRPIAAIKSWDDFRLAFRARCDELAVARVTVDHVGGLPSGLTSKLLAPGGLARFGPMSLMAMCGALGLALFVVEDHEALARIRHRLVPRDETAGACSRRACSRRGARGRSWVSKGDSAWGITMNHRRQILLPSARRKAIARKAAVIRWRGLGRSEAAP